MIGDKYWTVGIKVRPSYSPIRGWQWQAVVKFYDDGFMEARSTEGELHTRYFIDGDERGLDIALRTVRADAQALGIEFKTKHVYIEGDGTSAEYPPPANWKQILHDAAEGMGWRSVYSEDKS